MTRGLRRGPALAVLLGVVLNLGLLTLAHVPEQKALEGDEQYYFELARDRAGGEDRPDDAFWPPLYAVLLSGLFRLLGPQVLPAQLLQIGLWLAICVIWYRLSLALVGNRCAAFATLGLLLFGADLAPFAHYLWPETLHAALLSGAIAVLVLRRPPAIDLDADRAAPRSTRLSGAGSAHVVAGLLLGLALLTKLLLLPLLPVLVLLATLRVDAGRRLRVAGALALGIALPLAPVVVTNAQAGQPLLASSGVFNVWLGLNDPPLARDAPEMGFREAQTYRASAATSAQRNAIYRGRIADMVRSEGVLAIAVAQLDKQYVRLFDRDTFFVQQLPGEARSAYRFGPGALSTLLRGYAYLTHALLLASAAFGLAFLAARPLGWPHLFAGFLIYNLGLFFVLHVNPRFLVQLVPFLAFFGGIGTARLADMAGLGVGRAEGTEGRGAASGGKDGTAGIEPRRVATGVALAALVLYVAFRSGFTG